MSESTTTSPLPVPEGFDHLSVADKLRFIAELWERVEPGPVAAADHEEIVGQVARARLDEMRRDPSIGISREEVMRRVRERTAK